MNFGGISVSFLFLKVLISSLFNLAKDPRKIYESSEVEEKGEILNFEFLNLEMKGKRGS